MPVTILYEPANKLHTCFHTHPVLSSNFKGLSHPKRVSSPSVGQGQELLDFFKNILQVWNDVGE